MHAVYETEECETKVNMQYHVLIGFVISYQKLKFEWFHYHQANTLV